MSAQLDLFAAPDRKQERLLRYWHEEIYGTTRRNEHGCQIDSWFCNVWRYRHATETTGWSMACQMSGFIDSLHTAGRISDGEAFRLRRFDARVKRWRSA